MIQIPLSAIPNQSLTVRLGGSLFTIRITAGTDTMNIDIARNGEVVLTGERLLPNTAIIPYIYLEKDAGNLILTTMNQEYPVYIEFQVTQFLLYASAEEVENARS